MRRVLLFAALLIAAACKDDDATRPEPPATNADAGVTKPSDAGAKPDAAKASKLEQPGALPRAPKAGLPDDLRPPR